MGTVTRVRDELVGEFNRDLNEVTRAGVRSTDYM